MYTFNIYKPVIIFCTLCFIVISASALVSCSQLDIADNASGDLTGNERLLSLDNIGLKIESRISRLKLIAKTVALDSHIHAWIDSGQASPKAPQLISKLDFLVKEYDLTSASFADTQTNMYWNHEGFLRVLKPETDTWYFAYLKSAQQDLVSVYHDKNKHRVDLYVNYRQLNGKGLSGIATSFDGVLNMLKSASIGENGEVFLVDNTGKIQVHNEPTISGNASLVEMFSQSFTNELLQPNTTHFIDSRYEAGVKVGSTHIPSMDWYLIAVLE